jgi:PIN domain nuclease of toxin-antitoxin system
MRYLLDTHTFIWLATQPERISQRTREILDADEAQLLVSMATIWEMAIKVGLGKLTLDFPIEEFVERACSDFEVEIFQVEPRHVFRVASLPHHHRDPFDRLLIAQAEIEDMTLVGCDPHFAAYGIKCLW